MVAKIPFLLFLTVLTIPQPQAAPASDEVSESREYKTLYEEKFEGEQSGWYYAPEIVDQVRCFPERHPRMPAGEYGGPGCFAWFEEQSWFSHGIESRSPWWVDPNHAFGNVTLEPGQGFLNIVAFVDLAVLLATQTVTEPDALDLSDSEITADFDLRNLELQKGSHLRLWFQSQLPCPKDSPGCDSKLAGFVSTLDLDKAVGQSRKSRIKIPIRANEEEWKCIGARIPSRYSCQPLRVALQNVRWIGFVMMPVAPEIKQNLGSVLIDNILLQKIPIERAQWTNLTKARVIGDALTGSTTTNWTAGATSTMALWHGDGFVEFSGQGSGYRMIGLSHGDDSAGVDDIDFAIRLMPDSSSVGIFEKGQFLGRFGSYDADDWFRISVESGKVHYRRNGWLMHRSSGKPLFPLRVDTSMAGPEVTIARTVLGGSFWPKPSGDPVSWQPGKESEKGAIAPSTTEWRNLVGRRALLTGDGYVEIVGGQVPDESIIGLGRGSVVSRGAEMDFALEITSQREGFVREGGERTQSVGPISASDHLRISVEDRRIVFRKNGLLMAQSESAVSYPLYVGLVVKHPTVRVPKAILFGHLTKISGSGNWIRPRNLGVENDGIVKPLDATMGWNAGAVSLEALMFGDGEIEFAAGPKRGFRAVGMTRSDNVRDVSDLDFGIEVIDAPLGLLAVERGKNMSTVEMWEPSDCLGIRIEDGVVKYTRNGKVFYQSKTRPEFPVRIGTVIYTPGGEVGRVRMTGAFLECEFATCYASTPLRTSPSTDERQSQGLRVAPDELHTSSH